MMTRLQCSTLHFMYRLRELATRRHESMKGRKKNMKHQIRRWLVAIEYNIAQQSGVIEPTSLPRPFVPSAGSAHSQRRRKQWPTMRYALVIPSRCCCTFPICLLDVHCKPFLGLPVFAPLGSFTLHHDDHKL